MANPTQPRNRRTGQYRRAYGKIAALIALSVVGSVSAWIVVRTIANQAMMVLETLSVPLLLLVLAVLSVIGFYGIGCIIRTMRRD